MPRPFASSSPTISRSLPPLRRRDIYDPATIRELAGKIGTPERLKMLTLMTLADIKAVNPEALTPWKGENLWRLYTRTAGHFDRSADAERLDAETSTEAIEKSSRCCRRSRSSC